ncbi:hypothetical protein [Nonomuraea jabiensis]|uniref:hypothetical protein n=1 Tax=Nonomuraea jabiensis TaxID=882448 RepID=UPI0036764DF0
MRTVTGDDAAVWAVWRDVYQRAYLVGLDGLLSAIDIEHGPEGLAQGDQDGQQARTGTTTKKRRSGLRLAAECACTPPRRLQPTPKALDDGPMICGLCGERFEAELDHDEHDDEDGCARSASHSGRATPRLPDYLSMTSAS